MKDVICTDRKFIEASFLPVYQAKTLWSIAMNVQVDTVDPNAPANAAGVCPIISQMVTKTDVFDANMKKRIVSEQKENGLYLLLTRRHL